MSGTALVKPPKDDSEWARNTQRRLEQLENPTAQRVGAWVLSESDNGSLIASNVNGGSVVLASVPQSGENNPDAVVTGAPFIIVSKRGGLQAPGSDIVWDSVDGESGEWGAGGTGFTTLSIPDTGVYWISVYFQFGTAGDNTVPCGGILILDSTIVQADRGSGSVSGYPAYYASGLFPLPAGTMVRARHTGSLSVGAAPDVPSAVTSLSAIKLR